MENLDHDPSIFTGRGLDHDPSIFTGRGRDHLSISTAHEHNARVQDYSRMLQHVYAGTFFMMYVSLIGFIQVKSQKQNYSPFETHGFFIIMSVIALPIAVITSGILFYTNDPLEHTSKKNFSPIHYTLLKSMFLFSTIIAPLSLIPVLFIASKLNWIGYSIICALFAIVIVYNFCGYARLLKKKNVFDFAAHQMV